MRASHHAITSPLLVGSCILGLLLMFQGSMAGEAAESSRAVSAQQMMIRAHQARAEWNNFPGFTASLQVCRDGQSVSGRITVNHEGEIQLQLPDESGWEWVETSLRSVVAHRQPSADRKYDVQFADDETEHPLGRLIRLNKDLMGSMYRIKGDVITEVHRKMGAQRFTISVLEVSRNQEGKYLPRTYSFSTWDAKRGDLLQNTTVHNSWKRVGNYDLPERLLWVITKNQGQREVRQIRFRDQRLLDESADAAE